MLHAQRPEGALQLGPHIPGKRSGEHSLTGQIPPLLVLVPVLRADADTYLHRVGPEGLDRLPLHLGFEALEAVDVVGQLVERDVGAVARVELSSGVSLDRHDCSRRRQRREPVTRHLPVQQGGQVD